MGSRATSIPDDLDGLVGVARTLREHGIDTTYDALRQARLRNADTFPTETIGEMRFHRPRAVAQWLRETPRSRLRTRE